MISAFDTPAGKPSEKLWLEQHTAPAFAVGLAVAAACKCDSFEVITLANRAQAYLVPHKLDGEQIKLLYAMCPETWRNDSALAKRWDQWAVIADPSWSVLMRKPQDKPKPIGTILHF